MTEFLCSSYALLARRLMLIYRRTPAGEVLRTSAGLSSTESEIEEIHREMAQHRAACELCKAGTKADHRIAPMRRPGISQAAKS